MICGADRRLNVEQIKNHTFFYGVEWDAIRQIDPPFVPQLRSITDTTYFPTDEIEQGVVEDTAPDTNSGSDLAFLGCVTTQLSPWDLELTPPPQIYLQALQHRALRRLLYSVYCQIGWDVSWLVVYGAQAL